MFESVFRNLSVKTGYLIVLFGVIVLFVLGLLPNSITWIIIKVIYFAGLISYVFLHYLNVADTEEDEEEEENDVETEGTGQDWLKIDSDQNVEELFDRFLDNTLRLTQKVLVSESVVLLFANYSKKFFSIRHKITKTPERFISAESFDLMKGLPSLVLRNRTPLIENHLPEGNEIIPYYRPEDNESRSFAAVPVFFNDLIIGVLCADSTVQESFSNEDLELLKQFGGLISTQLVNSNRLYEYEAENWVGNVLFEVSDEMNRIIDVEDLWSYLSKKIPDVVECDRISISGKMNTREGKILRIEGGTGNLKPGRQFPLTEGIVGWVMRKNQPLRVEDFASKENYVPRFDGEETPAREYFSLLAVPVATSKSLIGTICLESTKTNKFNDQDKRILQTIANQAATIYTNASTVERLRQFSFKDSETKLENRNAFELIVPREIVRSKNFGLDLYLIFVKLYFQVEKNEPEIYRETINEFLSLCLPTLADTDYIFRLESDMFTVSSVQQDSKKITDFARALLQKVAQKKAWANGQAFDFYINIGIVTKEYLTNDIEKNIELGETAVKSARLKGPNNYLIYSGKQAQWNQPRSQADREAEP